MAHLYHGLESPDVHSFARGLSRLVTGHATVYRQRLDRDEQGGILLPSEESRSRQHVGGRFG